ncbi:hypothetical protein FIBSPDRAFT_882351 [Athelia psychrophila]|uniref:Zinc-finger domain-containing protein n=1 Tax=Athelia psychrophila TaxID=1759441 RepID=A0A166V969_9AGAM|nr:hypothetical protein FIBSPDRAFT_882351 [Fibularhizoctonia sp. CBS 109695]
MQASSVPSKRTSSQLSGHAQGMSTSPSTPPSTTTPPGNVQTAPMRTAEKPKVITAKKPRMEDLLRALRMAEQGLQDRDTQRGEVRTVKKPIIQRPARGNSLSAEGPSEMGEPDRDMGSAASSSGKASSSRVRTKRDRGGKQNAVKRTVNRQSTSRDKSTPYCHHCRSRNKHPKMRCEGYRGDRACELTFCRKCINKRYQDIQFKEGTSFICPKCLCCCKCTTCARKNNSIVPHQSEHPATSDSFAANDASATEGYYSKLYHAETGGEIGTAFVASENDPIYFYYKDVPVKKEEVD